MNVFRVCACSSAMLLATAHTAFANVQIPDAGYSMAAMIPAEPSTWMIFAVGTCLGLFYYRNAD